MEDVKIIQQVVFKIYIYTFQSWIIQILLLNYMY